MSRCTHCSHVDSHFHTLADGSVAWHIAGLGNEGYEVVLVKELPKTDQTGIQKTESIL